MVPLDKSSLAGRMSLGVGICVASVITTILTWYFYTAAHGGVAAYLEPYEVVLPQISYTGAAPPAYYVFSVGCTIGALVTRSALVPYLQRIYRTLVDMGLEDTSCPHCFFCCCCCCCDHARSSRANHGGGRESPEAPAAAAAAAAAASAWTVVCCCCCPVFLPYAAKALRPVGEVAIMGIIVLSIVSVNWSPTARSIHFIGAACFFYGCMVAQGLWISVRLKIISLAFLVMGMSCTNYLVNFVTIICWCCFCSIRCSSWQHSGGLRVSCDRALVLISRDHGIVGISTSSGLR